jgi:ssDNA thymidine ADP-ribosyltransferase, DarT
LDRHELDELQYIAHVDNVPSICSRGLLSHRKAAAIGHRSVADPGVQDRRKGKPVPGGLPLHDYANLYVTARNPMLFKKIEDGLLEQLCVVRISTAVLDLEDVVITDRNAAAFGCRFKPALEGLADVDAELITRTYWNDGDTLEQERCWNAKFTEILVPHLVEPHYLTGVYVGTNAARSALQANGVPLTIARDSELFFNRS